MFQQFFRVSNTDQHKLILEGDIQTTDCCPIITVMRGNGVQRQNLRAGNVTIYFRMGRAGANDFILGKRETTYECTCDRLFHMIVTVREILLKLKY